MSELTVRIADRWPTVVLGALTGMLLAAGAHTALPTRYEAVTVVHVDAADPELVDMTSEEAIATSRRVTSEALDTLGERTLDIDRLEHALSANAAEESRLLRIRFTAARPRLAALGADAVAHAYLAVRSVDAMQDPERPKITGVVVDPARLPQAASGPGLAPTALGGLVLGLLIATPVAARPSRRREARAS